MSGWFGKFIFGMPHRPNTPTNKESSFNFGSPGSTFGFNLESKSSPTKSVGEDKSEDEVEESDDIHFLPTIPLPDEIEVKTGEENEEVLYSHRAKLFRYDNVENEWKERGLGDIKLLQHKETGKLRLVMRREQILKLCLNHFVLPNLELKPKDEKTWLWCAADYSEGEIERTLFACRFKTSEIAKDFKDAIEDAKQKLSLDESTNEIATKGSPGQDIEVLYEMKVTPEEKKAALLLQLPENFYAYKQKPNCPGCRGCKEPIVPLFQTEGSKKIATVSKALAANRKPPTTLSTAQIHSKSTALNTASTIVTTGQTPISNTNTNASVLESEMYGTSAIQFSNTFSTTTASNLSFGNIDLTTTNDKKTDFSFVMPQSQSSVNEVQKYTSEKQSTVIPEDLKICSPVTTQSSTPFSFMAPTSTTTTAPIFEAANSNNAKKNIFGGTTKKETRAIIKPSTLSVNVNNPESLFSNNFNSESNTTSTTIPPVFGTTTPIFRTSLLKTEIGNTTGSISFSTTTATITSSTTDASVKSTNSVFPDTSAPFTFNLLSEPRTTGSAFSTSNPTTNAFDTITSSTSETQKEAEESFFTSTDISFSTLAAKSSQPAFKTDSNFSFVGAGSAVFGSKSNVAHNKTSQITKDSLAENKDENEEDSDQTENDQDHDPHFEPIIPLPDFVQVSTGEEDEEKVFCQRAKLYRFNKEWKERGIGEMKILHHEGRNVYRLLLRREKIHKVVCNLLLTPEIQFTKLASSDCTWMWAGLNYADEEKPCIEKLAVKFKTAELADDFMAVVSKIQEKLRTTHKK